MQKKATDKPYSHIRTITASAFQTSGKGFGSGCGYNNPTARRLVISKWTGDRYANCSISNNGEGVRGVVFPPVPIDILRRWRSHSHPRTNRTLVQIALSLSRTLALSLSRTLAPSLRHSVSPSFFPAPSTTTTISPLGAVF
jgi:hypothetical protein